MGRGGGGDEKTVEREEGRGEGGRGRRGGWTSVQQQPSNQSTYTPTGDPGEREENVTEMLVDTISPVMLTIDRIIYWAL